MDPGGEGAEEGFGGSEFAHGFDDEPGDNGGDEIIDLPTFRGEGYLILAPGEDCTVGGELPKARKLSKALVLHAEHLIVCDGKRRTVLSMPRAASDDGDPRVSQLVLVFIRYRATAPRASGRRYVIATNEQQELLGWVDHSPPFWDFQTTAVKALARYAGLECSTERFEDEDEFETAHPNWVGRARRPARPGLARQIALILTGGSIAVEPGIEEARHRPPPKADRAGWWAEDDLDF